MSNEIIDLVSKIKEKYNSKNNGKDINSNICQSCGGDVIDSVCQFCGLLNEDLNTLIEKLNNRLDYIDTSKVNQMSDVMNAIYTLKKFNIEKVNALLLKTNYEEIIKNKYLDISNKINNDIVLTNDDCKNYEFLFYNYEKEENKIYCCNYVFKSILTGKSNFSYNFFKEIVVYFAESFSEKLGIECKTSITELEENINGRQIYEFVFLDNKLMEDFYYNKNPKLLGTIFHEVTHLNQDKRQKNNEIVSLSNYIQLKEIIISNLNQDYYNQNYINVTFEKEARLNEYIYLIRYLKSIFGSSFTKEDEKEELERVNLTIMQNEDLLRIYKGNNVNVEDIFDEIILDNPNYLKEYPSLNIEYKLNEDGQVVRKMQEEIENDFLNIDFSTLDGNKFKVLKELYRYIRNKAKNKESNMSY